MKFDVTIFQIIKEIIESRIDTIDLAYNAPGGIEGWFQVEIFKQLYERNNGDYSQITREKPYPWKGAFCDFYLKHNNGTEIWVELKVDENNKINYAKALDSDIEKLGKLNIANGIKFAILISKNTYMGSEISSYGFEKIKTNKGTYNVWVIACD